MTPAWSGLDEQVIGVTAASRVWRAVAAVDGLVQRAWRHSAARRAGLAFIGSAVHSGGPPGVRVFAWTALWAALAALLLPFAGARRDGLGWIVPAGALLLAIGVLLLAPSEERQRSR